MKKYKLIKEYPGSFKLGSNNDPYSEEYCKKYPEYWEEIIKIPKYVKCLSSADGQFTKGKIYTVLSDSKVTHYQMIDDKGNVNGWSAHYFEPSTTEAYESQYKKTPITIYGWCYSYTDLLKLQEFMEYNKEQVKSLNVGCQGQYKVDLELINKIINRLEK